MCRRRNVTSHLVPWKSCGAYMAVMLGVATLAYLPFCIFKHCLSSHIVVLGFYRLEDRTYSASQRSPGGRTDVLMIEEDSRVSSRDLHPFCRLQPDPRAAIDCQFMHMKASLIHLAAVGSQSDRWRGT